MIRMSFQDAACRCVRDELPNGAEYAGAAAFAPTREDETNVLARINAKNKQFWGGKMPNAATKSINPGVHPGEPLGNAKPATAGTPSATAAPAGGGTAPESSMQSYLNAGGVPTRDRQAEQISRAVQTLRVQRINERNAAYYNRARKGR